MLSVTLKDKRLCHTFLSLKPSVKTKNLQLITIFNTNLFKYISTYLNRPCIMDLQVRGQKTENSFLNMYFIEMCAFCHGVPMSMNVYIILTSSCLWHAAVFILHNGKERLALQSLAPNRFHVVPSCIYGGSNCEVRCHSPITCLPTKFCI